MDTSTYRAVLDKRIRRREALADQIQQETADLERRGRLLVATEKAQAIVQQIAQTMQQRAHQSISRVVTQCLEAVFQDPYTFSIRFDQKRGKTEAQLILSRDGKAYEDAMNEVGGGVIDVASLALRLACVMLSRPTRDRVLILDEPFRNVRGEFNKRSLRALLLSLADEAGFQFILNVDSEAYPEFTLGSIEELG